MVHAGGEIHPRAPAGHHERDDDQDESQQQIELPVDHLGGHREDLIHEARHAGEPAPGGGAWRTAAVPADDETPEIAVRGVARLHGLLVLELHGHLAHMVGYPGAVYDREVDAAADWAVTVRRG